MIVVFLKIVVLFTVVGFSSSDILSYGIVNYPCGDGFFPVAVTKPTECPGSEQQGRVANVACLDGGRVNTNTSAKYVYLERPLATQDRLVIIGVPLNETVMHVSLLSGMDSALYMGARFKHDGTFRTIIRNSRVGGTFGQEETDHPYFPYTVNTWFNTTILVESDKYKIFVDDTLIFTYGFRVSNPSVKRIRLHGDILIKAMIVDSL